MSLRDFEFADTRDFLVSVYKNLHTLDSKARRVFFNPVFSQQLFIHSSLDEVLIACRELEPINADDFVSQLSYQEGSLNLDHPLCMIIKCVPDLLLAPLYLTCRFLKNLIGNRIYFRSDLRVYMRKYPVNRIYSFFVRESLSNMMRFNCLSAENIQLCNIFNERVNRERKIIRCPCILCDAVPGKFLPKIVSREVGEFLTSIGHTLRVNYYPDSIIREGEEFIAEAKNSNSQLLLKKYCQIKNTFQTEIILSHGRSDCDCVILAKYGSYEVVKKIFGNRMPNIDMCQNKPLGIGYLQFVSEILMSNHMPSYSIDTVEKFDLLEDHIKNTRQFPIPSCSYNVEVLKRFLSVRENKKIVFRPLKRQFGEKEGEFLDLLLTLEDYEIDYSIIIQNCCINKYDDLLCIKKLKQKILEIKSNNPILFNDLILCALKVRNYRVADYMKSIE